MEADPLTAEQRGEWDAWLAERHENVRAVAEKLPPWHLYRVVETGQHATIQSYDEPDPDNGYDDVTISVTAWQPWLPVVAHGVFGMPPDHLVIEEPYALLTAGDK